MVIIWDIAGQARGKGKAGAQPSLPLQDQPRQILYGHRDAVVCMAVCTQLDLVVSAAADGNLLFHTLSNGRQAPLGIMHHAMVVSIGQQCVFAASS